MSKHASTDAIDQFDRTLAAVHTALVYYYDDPGACGLSPHLSHYRVVSTGFLTGEHILRVFATSLRSSGHGVVRVNDVFGGSPGDGHLAHDITDTSRPRHR